MRRSLTTLSRHRPKSTLATGRRERDRSTTRATTVRLVRVSVQHGQSALSVRNVRSGKVTIAAMRAFGATVEQPTSSLWRVLPGGYQATDYLIEPDASAATYLWAMEVLTNGKIDLGVANEDFTQPDASAQAVIASFPNMPATIEGSQMQDAIPTLAVLAAFNKTSVRFTGIANLRVKECDRIRALSTGLNNIRDGLAFEDGDDLVIHSDPALAGQTLPTSINTFADHRIAMSFALAGLKINRITILDPDCVGKTYPQYWDALRSLGVELI